jgi:hypothetical protein
MKSRFARSIRSRSGLALALIGAGILVWGGSTIAQHDGKPTSKFAGQEAYAASLAEAEAEYVKQVLAARQQYVQSMKHLLARARMTAEVYNAYQAEIKRIESLGNPQVDPEPAKVGGVREVGITMDTPNPLWSIHFVKAKTVDGELWVLWQLKSKDGMAAAVISSVSASAKILAGDLPDEAVVRHYVIGKRWNWEDPKAKAKYVSGEDDLGPKWAEGNALKQANADGGE